MARIMNFICNIIVWVIAAVIGIVIIACTNYDKPWFIIFIT